MIFYGEKNIYMEILNNSDREIKEINEIMNISINETLSDFFNNLNKEKMKKSKLTLAICADLVNYGDNNSKVIDSEIVKYLAHRLAFTYNSEEEFNQEISNLYLDGIPYKSENENKFIKYTMEADEALGNTLDPEVNTKEDIEEVTPPPKKDTAKNFPICKILILFLIIGIIIIIYRKTNKK